MYYSKGLLWASLILASNSLFALGDLERGKNQGNILEEVDPPIHECESSWGDSSYDPIEECVKCNLRVPLLDFNTTFSDCDITVELLQGLQEVIDYALHVINEGFLDNHFPQLLRMNDNDGYCSARRREEYNLYSTCEDIVSAMQSTMCEIIEQICLLMNPGEAEKCYDDMPTPSSTTTGPTTTTQSPGNPEDRECIKCLLDAISVYSTKLREIQSCFLGAIDSMKQEHAAEVDNLNLEIKGLQQNLKDSLWDFMLAQIENPETAAIIFPQLYPDEDDKLVKYVEQVYTLGNYTNVIVFGFRLPHIHQTSLVYYTLYDVVYANNHENHGNIIVFMKYLKESEAKWCATDIRECGSDFATTKYLVELYLGEYIRVGVENIKSGNWRGLLQFGNPTEVGDVGESFKLILEELVEKACGDFSRTLNFVKNIRWNEHRYLALQRFKNCVTNQHHMLSIAYEIKNAHDNLQGPDSDKYGETQANLEKLKDSLDMNIQVIVWDGGTLNAAGSGYLAPGSGGGGYTGVSLSSNAANNKWTFVKDTENLNENEEKRFGFRLRHQSGVYLGVPFPIRVSGSREPLCVANAPSENWIDSSFYWEVKFGSQGNQIYLYHPERRLHMGSSGLYRAGTLLPGDYMILAK